MNFSKIKHFDIANGPGIRVSLFVSGCPHKCIGCFNEETWDYNNGKEFSNDTIEYILKELEKPYYKGFSLLGGEPFAQNTIGLKLLTELCEKIKKQRPDIKLWVWSGYLFEEIIEDKEKLLLLENFDVVVDGRFIESEKDLSLKYCGSTNQRVIKVKESLKEGKIVFYEE